MKKFLYPKKWKALTAGLLLSLTPVLYSPMPVFAAQSAEDIEAQIAEQEQILRELNSRKKNAQTDALKSQISSLESQIEEMKHKENYDSKGAIESMAAQLAGLKEQLDEQQRTQRLLVQTIEKLDKLVSANKSEPVSAQASYRKVLVNPGPKGNVSYTQDAVNAQNDSTMVFTYSPDQLYKIYCRTGYLTDIELHKGEKINFVGGGDTSSWAINSATIAGTPHIYIKPVVQSSTTNIIVTTDKRSYQLIVCTDNWYNPMVRWTYGQEEAEAAFIQSQKDERTITDRMNVVDSNKLNFNYKVSVKGDSDMKPEMVFDDGEKTLIRFRRTSKTLPALFIRERGHKGVSLANFKVKDNTYILDRVIDKAELRFSDSNIITIERGK